MLARHVVASTTAMAAAAPDGPAAAVVAGVDRYDGGALPMDDDPCGDFQTEMTSYELVVSDLLANPDAVSAELEAGLVQPVEGGGVGGLANFVGSAEFTDAEYPGLGDLRTRLDPQREVAAEAWEGS